MNKNDRTWRGRTKKTEQNWQKNNNLKRPKTAHKLPKPEQKNNQNDQKWPKNSQNRQKKTESDQKTINNNQKLELVFPLKNGFY